MTAGGLLMIDFTKDELQICVDGIGWMISECEMSHNKLEADAWRETYGKIQSMIDNYCEHERTYTDSAMIKGCDDCGWIGGMND
jgi:hypothetical protein